MRIIESYQNSIKSLVNPHKMVHLDDVQTSEDMIASETIDYFMRNPDELFRTPPQIKIFPCDNQPFKYYSADGNTRLFVCHLRNITDIPIEVSAPDPEELSLQYARQCYNEGIRHWRDLRSKVVPEEVKFDARKDAMFDP